MAIRIEAALDQINSYPEMDRFLANSEVSLSSIVGSRMLTAPGCVGAVHLDIAVRKWYHLDGRPGPFSNEERVAAESGQNRLLAHYRTTDRLLNESYNVLVVAWRALIWLISSICDRIEGRARGNLQFYLTSSTYRKVLNEAGGEKRPMNVFDEAWLQQRNGRALL